MQPKKINYVKHDKKKATLKYVLDRKQHCQSQQNRFDNSLQISKSMIKKKKPKSKKSPLLHKKNKYAWKQFKKFLHKSKKIYPYPSSKKGKKQIGKISKSFHESKEKFHQQKADSQEFFENFDFRRDKQIMNQTHASWFKTH